MLHRFISTIIFVLACVCAGAQGTCVINGTIADVKAADGKKVKKVYLTRTNEFGEDETVAEAKVKKGKFTFKRELAKDELVLMYKIKGLSRNVELFVEPGEVTVVAGNPGLAWGTPANDALFKYKEICMEEHAAVLAKEKELAVKNGNEWLESAEGKAVMDRIKAQEAIKNQAARLRFLIDHNSSPMTPYIAEHVLLPKLTDAYADQVVKSISTTLHNHPYYLSLRNKVLSRSLKVGNEVPDIMLPMLGGEQKHLKDFRGKYVVLNFWANGCDKSAAMLAEMQNLYNVVKENSDKFVMISFALESDAAAWRAAVESGNMNLEDWLHACDGIGAESPAAKSFKVDNAPRIILIEPEGRAVSLDMDIDEVVMRVEQILSGDLYYLDQEK